MADYPDRWISDIKAELGEGFPPAPADVNEFLDRPGNEDLREAFDTGIESGLSLDWSILLSDVGAPTDPNDWDSLTIQYDHSNGNWDVLLTDDDGKTHVISDVDWDDLIWYDIWGVAHDYDVDTEVDYGED